MRDFRIAKGSPLRLFCFCYFFLLEKNNIFTTLNVTEFTSSQVNEVICYVRFLEIKKTKINGKKKIFLFVVQQLLTKLSQKRNHVGNFLFKRDIVVDNWNNISKICDSVFCYSTAKIH